MKNNTQVQYQDEVPSSMMVVAILGLTVAIIAFVAFAQIYKSTEMTAGMKIFVYCTLLLGLLVLVSFRKLKVTVTNSQIIFGFGKFRKKIGLGNIIKAEIKEFKFSNYLGYGVRFGRDGTVGYVPRGGKGILLKAKGERKPLFFICNNPEQLKAILDRYAK